MGNRAVITIMDQNEENNFNKENIGVYLIKNWEIVGRVYHEGREQNSYKLLDMLLEINDKQPLSEQLDVETISKYVAEIQEGGW